MAWRSVMMGRVALGAPLAALLALLAAGDPHAPTLDPQQFEAAFQGTPRQMSHFFCTCQKNVTLTVVILDVISFKVWRLFKIRSIRNSRQASFCFIGGFFYWQAK